MTEIEPVVEPHRVLDNFCWKTISFVDVWIIHSVIVAEYELTCQYRQKYNQERPGDAH